MSQQRAPRQWTITRDEYVDDEAFRQAITEELAGLENMGYRLGGAFIATPLRHRVEGRFEGVDEFEVIGWVFQQAFAPAVREREPEPPSPLEETFVPAEQPEPVEEPEAIVA